MKTSLQIKISLQLTPTRKGIERKKKDRPVNFCLFILSNNGAVQFLDHGFFGKRIDFFQRDIRRKDATKWTMDERPKERTKR